MLAMEARAEKGDAGFFRAVAAIYKSQPKLADSDLLAIAHDLGLNAARVKRAMAKKTYQKAIDADAQLAVDFKTRGTPTFFINGYRVAGAQPRAKFEAVIDEQLQKAEALVANGVPAAGVYARIMKDAKDVPQPETKSVAAPTKVTPVGRLPPGPWTSVPFSIGPGEQGFSVPDKQHFHDMSASYQ